MKMEATSHEAVMVLRDLDQKIQEINGGRSSTVITAAIMYLERNDLESAKAVLLNDRDKLWQYDDATFCISILESMGLLPSRGIWGATSLRVTAWDLLRVEAIKKFLVANPREAGPVFDQVILYLESGDEDQARYKIMLDSDKFLDKKSVVQFMDSIDLLDPEYRERLVRAKVLD